LGHNPVVDDPKLVKFGIGINARHYPDPFDDPVGIATPLALNQIHFEREVLIHNGVIEHEVTFGALLHLTFHILPNQVGCNFFLLPDSG